MFVAQFIFDEPLGPSQPPSGGSVSRWEAWEVSSVGESSESFYANLAALQQICPFDVLKTPCFRKTKRLAKAPPARTVSSKFMK